MIDSKDKDHSQKEAMVTVIGSLNDAFSGMTQQEAARFSRVLKGILDMQIAGEIDLRGEFSYGNRWDLVDSVYKPKSPDLEKDEREIR